MIQLTQEQGQALQEGETPPRVYDPCTSSVYVLVPTDVYDRAKAILGQDDEEFVHALTQQAMEAFGREGWDDPSMDIYNDLDPRRQ